MTDDTLPDLADDLVSITANVVDLQERLTKAAPAPDNRTDDRIWVDRLLERAMLALTEASTLLDDISKEHERRQPGAVQRETGR